MKIRVNQWPVPHDVTWDESALFINSIRHTALTTVEFEDIPPLGLDLDLSRFTGLFVLFARNAIPATTNSLAWSWREVHRPSWAQQVQVQCAEITSVACNVRIQESARRATLVLAREPRLLPMEDI